jgi:hypothetical protein
MAATSGPNFLSVLGVSCIIIHALSLERTMSTQRRTFYGPDIDIAALAHALADNFSGEGFEVQILAAANSGSTVQARKEDTLRKVVGMSTALTTIFTREGEYVCVDVGGAHWLDKGVAAGVGAVLFFPALITAGIGAYQQSHLNNEAWQFVEQYIRTNVGQGSKRKPANLNDPPAIVTQCPNPQCGQSLVAGARFCPACGTVISKRCLNCGHELPDGAGFCGGCGSPVAA